MLYQFIFLFFTLTQVTAWKLFGRSNQEKLLEIAKKQTLLTLAETNAAKTLIHVMTTIQLNQKM